MWIIQITALTISIALHGLAQSPNHNDKCREGSCYPASGDLLIGRAHRLTASSTCGLDGPETFCIDEKNYFECDSRETYNEFTSPNSHTIENVVTTFAPNRLKTWWQSENGVENVTIQLDLEAEFHFTHLIMTFKTFRPAAMLIEHSADYGRSWQVYRYYAFNCTESYPHVPQGPIRKVYDVICDSRYSGIQPSTGGEVIFRALDPALKIPDPYSPHIQNLLKITNLRIRMEKLHTLDDDLFDERDEVKEKYYYALYDMVVRGNCFCYGHASKCAPVGDEAGVEGMVHSHCMCNHHTTGLNCEECEDFYQDLPWRPAVGREKNACKRCECNHHSHSCHFDMAAYLSSGNRSGGVCDDCQHNTEGQWCENCKPFYYKHPGRDIRDPRICEPCDCDPRGSLNGGLCDSATHVLRDMIAGQCRCKANVEGQRCDYCKKGHYGLSDDPLGCQPCSCNPLGTFPKGSPCNIQTGSCYCKRLVTGRNCDLCLPQHWGLSNDMDGCRPCDCDVGGALNNNCSRETGQCACKKHMFGRRCDQVHSGYYIPALDHYIYEAEDALFGPEVKVVQRTLPLDRKPTWTGNGFVNIPEGETLRFNIYNLPRSMEYNLMIRYEPLLPDEWEKVVVQRERPRDTYPSAHCTSTYSDEQTISLHPGSRYVVLPGPVCLEKGQNYTVKINFRQYSSYSYHTSPHTLVDSMVLLPEVQDLDLFSGGAQQWENWEMFQKYRCMERSQGVIKIPLTNICKDFIFSVSALLHNGALECKCDPQGSLSTVCDNIGGQCRCRPNVLGRNCDTCAPDTYLFGPSGCRPCDCNPLGSQNPFCHPTTGQCLCVPGAFGRQCGNCKPNHWDFPQCQPCFCNGNSEQCHTVTGECLNCRGHTTGHNCERCESGYHRNTLLGSSEPCRPCMCPNGPGSGMEFAESCYQNPSSLQMVCVCNSGYKGPKCEECASGYYGDPQVPGGRCHPCQCNGNINMQDPGSCDARTGACLKCLFHTDGNACQYCSHGYYGDAHTQNCRKCMCHLVGSSRQSCADGLCECDRVSGQCPCLPGVVGQQCDRCAPNTWNINSGKGCLPCQCNPEHSYTASCDRLTGECSCKPGFGGTICEECRELFWGNPEVQCHACDCDPRGIATQQCDKMTGECVCVEGVAGRSCDSCGRGYVGTFPDCGPCHHCFSEWDVNVGELTNRTQRLVDTVEDMKETGVATPYKDIISSLDDETRQLRQILEDDKVQQMLTHMQRMLQQANETASVLRMSIDRSEKDLENVSADNQHALESLKNLTEEAQNLQEISSDKQQQILNIKHSDPRGAADSIREYNKESGEAEFRVNKAVSDPKSTVKESAQIRKAAETKLESKEEEFNRTHQLHLQRLDKIGSEMDSTDLSQLSHRLCGGASGLDGCGNCGGLGCVSEDGMSQCGGEGCETIVTQIQETLNKVKNQDALHAIGEIGKLSKMVSDARGHADKSKLNAQDVLVRANQSKARVEQANEELRDLIQQIRDFLTNETEPKRIEEVADEVMKLSLPVSVPGALKNVTTEIREHVARLTQVDDILAQTAENAHTAERILQEAQAADERATALKQATDEVKETLEDTERAQTAASEKLKEVEKGINQTKHQIADVQSKTEATEFKLSSSTVTLLDIEREVNELQQKTLETYSSENQTQKQTDNINAEIKHTEREFDSLMQHEYKLASGVIDQKGAAVFNAHQKAEQLRQEAKDLLKDATKKLQRLSELEKSFVAYQRILVEKAQEMDGLESEARDVLQDLSQKITIYSTCA
ncbi:laminin subunit beta-1-like isoform X1 [Carassius auratus]|uniref:Laminin subunit beta-1-like isoform X1 n=2 Tax=Carassius auratus TaxID=7957 RepID=A0A6P6K0S1_CARAU|nr:laminin subunit beta-1-like isoform X1 [Carassius auratus]